MHDGPRKMASHECFSVPDPCSWLWAAAPLNVKPEIEAWASWIVDLLLVDDVSWNQRQRAAACEAFLAGSPVHIPCGPLPVGSITREAAVGWLYMASLSVTDRFKETSWEVHILPWAREIASLAGFKGTWRHPHIDAIVMAMLLMVRLDGLGKGGTSSRYAAARDGKERQRTVWRECIRIRQYLADVLPITKDLPRRARGPFKEWWFTCLEWSRLAEEKGAALWDEPIFITRGARIRIVWQRWFGKLAFK